MDQIGIDLGGYVRRQVREQRLHGAASRCSHKKVGEDRRRLRTRPVHHSNDRWSYHPL